jgi:hypothetical protein
MSGAPEDSNSNSSPSKISRGDSAIIHRTVRCSKGERPQELASFGKLQRLLRYNSPDMSGVHRTVRCNCGGNSYSTPTVTCRRIKCARCTRRGQTRPCWRTGHSTVHVRCATGHQGGPRRQSSNGRTQRLLVTWPSHRTCPVCTGLSGAPSTDSLHQRSSLVVGAINTPTTPTFKLSKFSNFQPLYKS